MFIVGFCELFRTFKKLAFVHLALWTLMLEVLHRKKYSTENMYSKKDISLLTSYISRISKTKDKTY